MFANAMYSQSLVNSTIENYGFNTSESVPISRKLIFVKLKFYQ